MDAAGNLFGTTPDGGAHQFLPRSRRRPNAAAGFPSTQAGTLQFECPLAFATWCKDIRVAAELREMAMAHAEGDKE
jgi:hypothetical protein